MIIPSPPSKIVTYLDEIAERLWSNHSTIMVGAGFSRNARKAIPSAPDFPTWTQLADYFHGKLYNSKPENNTTHYLSPLKLADEVQAAFGRAALDQMIRTHVPDKEYEPSDLHVKLLELPWVDIFTVNYDTLLERASSKVTSRRFDVVVNKDDLVYSTRPRIIKLHGSFPSIRPFTISEEDYRRYPNEQAPFVNTVQQSLLENTLCLIGFSGDDPNFLHWIGWVRDNLGKENSPKIYLIGSLRLTDAQRKLFEQRNVVLVDLAEWTDSGSDHAKALTLFIEYLSSKQPQSSFKWPRKNLSLNAQVQIPLQELISHWKEQRETYPNWVVAPDDARQALLLSLQMHSFFLPRLEEMLNEKSELEFSFLYELNWQLERALYPILNDMIPHYERILEKHFFATFPEHLNQITSSPNEFKAVSKLHWLDLKISLLRIFREEAMHDKWKSASAQLFALKDALSPEQVARIGYESCLFGLFINELHSVREALALWPVNSALPFWEAKRASIMAEMGDLKESIRILESSLTAIRSRQQLTPVLIDLTWVSQECHVMHLLQSIQLADRLGRNKFNLLDNSSPDQTQLRRNELKLYQCDPWNDLKIFNIELKSPPIQSSTITKSNHFDIGMESSAYHWEHDRDRIALGFAFLRYCEEVGLPFELTNLNIVRDQAVNASQRIANASPSWAASTLIRMGDPKLADIFFKRKALVKLPSEGADLEIARFVKIFNYMRTVGTTATHSPESQLAIRILKSIPEVVSRLCSKCSATGRSSAYALLKDIYALADNVSVINELKLNKFPNRIFTSMSHRERFNIISELCQFPLLSEATPWLSLQNLPELLNFVEIPSDKIEEFGNASISPSTIITLTTSTASHDSVMRSRAGSRLARLYEWNLLTASQIEDFGKALWSSAEPNKLPKASGFHAWAFLKLPIPPGIDVVTIFKKYIFSWNHTSIAGAMTVTQSGMNPIHLTGGHIPWCIDLIASTKQTKNNGLIDWNHEECEGILDILTNWWNSGKEHLLTPKSDFSDIRSEFLGRYRNLVNILLVVVVPRTNPDTKAFVDKLDLFLTDFEKYDVPCAQLKVACVQFFPSTKITVLHELETGLNSGDRLTVIDALRPIIDWANGHSSMGDPIEMGPIELLGQQIRWRRATALTSALNVAKAVVSKRADLLSNSFLLNLDVGLKWLLPESAITDDDSDQIAAEKMGIRRSSAALAYALHLHFTKNQTPPLPSISYWRDACADKNEFAEIRNEWE